MYLIEKNQKYPIPLKSIDLKLDIVQQLAAFEMTQEYVNMEDVPLETVFLFPRDIESVISNLSIKFTTETGEKHIIETRIEEREKVELKF
jgi:von Willebrand factor A domain-containing protein 5